MLPADVDEVGASDIFRIRTAATTEEADEMGVAVGVGKCGSDGVGRYTIPQLCGGGGDDAGVHRNEVREETDSDFFPGGEAELLLDF